MFGTGEKFDLTHAVYAREGSAFFLIENYYSHLLQLSSYKPGAWLNANPFLFNLRAFQGETEMPYTYHGDPGSIRLTSAAITCACSTGSPILATSASMTPAGSRNSAAISILPRGPTAVSTRRWRPCGSFTRIARSTAGSWFTETGPKRSMTYE